MDEGDEDTRTQLDEGDEDTRTQLDEGDEDTRTQLDKGDELVDLSCRVLLRAVSHEVGHPGQVVAHVHTHGDGDAFTSPVLGPEGGRESGAGEEQEQEQRSPK